MKKIIVIVILSLSIVSSSVFLFLNYSKYINISKEKENNINSAIEIDDKLKKIQEAIKEKEEELNNIKENENDKYEDYKKWMELNQKIEDSL